MIAGGVDHDLRGSAALALNTWAHVATTYDGATLALYVDGALVGSQAATGAIATSTGALQDRRQHDLGRVLRRTDRRGAHLQPRADAGRDPERHDAEHRHARHDAPAAPGNADCDRRDRLGLAELGRGDDNVGVVRYNVHRGTTAGFTPTRREPDSAADRHELHRRRRSPPAPTTTGSPPRTRRATSARLAGGERHSDLGHDSALRPANVTATARRGPGVADLERARRTTSASSATTCTGRRPPASRRRRQPNRAANGPSYTDTGLAAGTYYYKVIAADASGNLVDSVGTGDCRRRPQRHPSASLLRTASMKGAVRRGGQLWERQQRDRLRGDLGDRQVRHRAVLRRRQRHRQRPGLGEPRPDDRNDDRGVGAPARPRQRGGLSRSRNRAATTPRLSTEHRNQPPSANIVSGGSTTTFAARRRCRSTHGCTSRRRMTPRRCGCMSMAPLSRRRRDRLDLDLDRRPPDRR